MNRPPRWLVPALGALPLLVIGGFVAWPFVTLVASTVDSSALGDTFTTPATWNVVWFTTWQAALSTVLTLAIGLAPALVFARYVFVGREVMLGLLTALFVLPTVVMGAAIGALLPSSIDRTVWAVLAAHVVFNLAVVVRVVGALWERLPRDIEGAAATLGAAPARVLLHVTLPQLRPALVAAGSVVFVFTFTSFGVIRVLAAPGTRTLEVEIWRNATQLGRIDAAAVLALLQLVVLIAVASWAARSQRRRGVALALDSAPNRLRPRTIRSRLFVGGVAGGVAVVSVMPLLALVVRSMSTPTGWSTRAWTQLGALDVRPGISLGIDPREAITRSITAAAWATLIAVLIGGLASLAIALSGTIGRILDGSSILPIAVSAVTVGFGLLITFDSAPVDWRRSWWLVPLGQAIVALPFVIRNCVGVLRSVDPQMTDAALTLGASPARAWASTLVPYLWRPLAAGGALAAAISLGEFGATSLLSRSGDETMPVAIEQLIGRAGSVLQAQGYVLATLLAVIVVAIVMIIEQVVRRGGPLFARSLHRGVGHGMGPG